MTHFNFSRPKIVASRRGLLMSGGALFVSAALRPIVACGQGAPQRLEVQPGGAQPLPIAIADFVAGSASEGDTPRNMSGVITNNLRRSGLFAPIEPAAFIEKISNIDTCLWCKRERQFVRG